MDQELSDQQMAQATLQLLQRVDLKGGEVPQFVQISNWLTAMSQQNLEPVPTSDKKKAG